MVETNRIASESASNSRHHTEQEKSASMLPEACQQAGENVKRYVEENPVVATAVTFGVGLGIGFLATAMMRSASASTNYGMASRLGQAMLDKANAVLPDSLVDRFKS